MMKFLTAAAGLLAGLFLAWAAYRAPEAPGAVSAQAASAQFSNDQLFSDWNLIAGTGTSPEAFAARYPCAAAIYGWDAERQRWTSWFLGAPDYVNQQAPIGTLLPSRGYWVHCTGSPGPQLPALRLTDIAITATTVTVKVINLGFAPHAGPFTVSLTNGAESSSQILNEALNPGQYVTVTIARPFGGGEYLMLLAAGGRIADQAVVLLAPRAPCFTCGTPTPTPSPSATPTPSPSATPTPSPSVTSTPSPSATSTPTPEPSATPEPEPEPSPSPEP